MELLLRLGIFMHSVSRSKVRACVDPSLPRFSASLMAHDLSAAHPWTSTGSAALLFCQ